jgi:hypothetical protein
MLKIEYWYGSKDSPIAIAAIIISGKKVLKE